MARGIWFRAALAAGLLAQAASASASALVIRSIGPSARRYPVGQRVADAAQFTLRPGDAVTILFQGRTRVFRGPGTYSPMDPARPRALAGAVAARSATGAVRAPTAGRPMIPDYRMIDASVAQTACIFAGARPTLWRASATTGVSVRVSIAGGQDIPLTWAAGQNQLALPAGVGEGTQVVVGAPGGMEAVRVGLTALGAVGDDPEAIANALIGHNCRTQLDAFAASREEP